MVLEWQSLRLVAAGALGGALGAAGSTLQRYLNNDLADPYLLGMSGASVLGAVGMSLVLPALASAGPNEILFTHLFGSFVAGAIVLLLIVWARGRFYHNAEGLVVFGVVINAVCSALTMILMNLDNPIYPKIDYSWFIGRIESYGAAPTLVLLGLVALGVVALYGLRNAVERSPYGAAYLRRLKIQPVQLNSMVLLAVWIIVSTVSAFAGSIGFVGLMIPHLARRISQGFSRELVWSVILGACFLAFADHLSRRLAYPRVLPVGIVTSLCGSVALGVLLLRARSLRRSRRA